MQSTAGASVGASPVRLFANQQARNLLVEIAVMAGSTIVCIALYLGGDPEIVNYLAPATILVVGGAANLHMIRQDSQTLLTPLFAMRLIALVVFGFGGLSHNWASFTAQESFDYMMVTSPAETARVHLLWLGGMDAMLIGTLIAMQLFVGIRVRPTGFAAPVSFKVAAWLFWAGFLGIVASLIVPTVTVPGLVQTLLLAGELSGIFLMGKTAGAKPMFSVVIGWSGLSLVFAALYFMNKSMALYPLLCLVIGFLSNKINLRRIIIGTFLIGGVFIFIAPIITSMRTDQVQSHGQLVVGSMSEQLESIERHIVGPPTENNDDSTNGRFDYVVPAAFAMNQYDAGFSIDFIAKSGMSFIPRFIWPDKPALTTGDQVNHRMGFQGTNSIGVTVFADLYWNFGWMGMVLIIAMGLFNGVVTILNRELMRMEDWIMIPFIMSTFRSALNLDNEFVAAILVPAVLNFILFFAIRIGTTLFQRRNAVPA